MERMLDSLVRIAATEFDGPSLMGKALLPCIEEMSLDQVTRTDTYEGYSVWGIALHVLYHKYSAIQLIGGKLDGIVYPYQEADWPALPEKKDQAGWNRLLGELKSMQKAWLAALDGFPMKRWNEPIPAWGCTVGQVVDCIVLHDLYHVAQIRNMGLIRR